MGSGSISEEGAVWPAAPRLPPLASVSGFESFAEYGGMTLNSSLSSSSSSSSSSICENREWAVLSINGFGRAWKKVQGLTALKAGIKHTEPKKKNTSCCSCSKKPCCDVHKNSFSQEVIRGKLKHPFNSVHSCSGKNQHSSICLRSLAPKHLHLQHFSAPIWRKMPLSVSHAICCLIPIQQGSFLRVWDLLLAGKQRH